MHTTQVLPSLLTLRFLILERLFRLQEIALEGDNNPASESVLRLASLKDLHAAETAYRNEALQMNYENSVVRSAAVKDLCNSDVCSYCTIDYSYVSPLSRPFKALL